MEAVLHDLIAALRSASSQMKGDMSDSMATALHGTSSLPNIRISSLASDALDLLSEIRLMLEPAQLVLADHFFGYMNTKALVAVVELDIPDFLSRGPMTLSELARNCRARPDRLQQVMRTLFNNGIFAYDEGTGTWAQNHTSSLLTRDHWTQWRNWVELYGSEFYDMARGIPLACKDDARRCPAQINFDTDDTMFKYFTDQNWTPKFHKTLSGGAVAQSPGILEDYPWEELAETTVVDVGGGGGGFISLLLRRYKGMKGAILDIPKVIEQARSNFHDSDGVYADVSARIPLESLIVGDFFQEVPPSEAYTMKWCLHDWNDEKAVQILKTVRRSIKRSAKSRLVVLESVLQDGHRGIISRYGDMNMMVAVGGKERDANDWRCLADRSGWELRKIYHLRNAWPCAIEFVPIWSPEEAPSVQRYAPSSERAVDVVSTMRFLEPWDASRGDPYVRINAAPGYNRTNFEWKSYPVRIQDARPSRNVFDLDQHGFAYVDDSVSEDLICALRRNDSGTVQELYYPHVEEFLKRLTGAPRVIIFDHTLRKRRLELDKTANDDGKEQPATMVHVDQSEKGALRRLKMNIGDEENFHDVLKGRVQMINVWRPLNGPVRDWPLATMDYRSAKSSDVYPCNLLRGEHEERGQTMTLTFRPEQKWYYLDRQRNNEVTVIKIWDNHTGVTSKFCAHAAFHHPHTADDAESRESVEVRCLVIHSDCAS